MTNEHHKIEAIFKVFAKAIKMAVKQDVEKMILPSTKGMYYNESRNYRLWCRKYKKYSIRF